LQRTAIKRGLKPVTPDVDTTGMRRVLAFLAAAVALTGCGAGQGDEAAPSTPSTPAATDARANWKTHDREGYVVRVPPTYIDDMTTVRSLTSTQKVPAALYDAFRRVAQETPVVDQLALAETDRSYGKTVPTLLNISVIEHGRPMTPARLEQRDLQVYEGAAFARYMNVLSHRHVKLPAGTAIEWQLTAPWNGGGARFAAVQYSFAHGSREYAVTVNVPANNLAWARREARSVAATFRLR
jgi:hypothetical protein